MDEEPSYGGVIPSDGVGVPDVAEVEAVIQSMYTPGQNPETISKLDTELRRLQRTPAGWKLGDDLLDSEDERVRFFGALTLTIKINNDWSELRDEDVLSLFQRLLQRLLQSVDRNVGSIVARKLCSALVAYFLRPNVSWTRCLRTLIVAFKQGQIFHEQDIDSSITLDLLLSELKLEQMMTLLWFSQILAEEVSKHDSRRMSSTGILDRITPNLIDIMDMLQVCLNQTLRSTSSNSVTSLGHEALGTLQAWVKLSHHTWITDETYSRPVSALLPVAISCVPIEGLTQVATDLICDVIKEWSKLFDETNHHAILSLMLGPFGTKQVSDLQSGDFDDEKISFANLILEYVDMQANQFAKQTGEQIAPMQTFVSAELLECCHKLLRCEGTPFVEDDVCILSAVVWINLVGILDDSPAPRNSTWFQEMKGHVLQAIRECLQKLRLPPNEVVTEWDQEQLDGFSRFRIEISEIFELGYWFLQLPEVNELFDILVQQVAAESLKVSDWEGLEVSLYCLNAIAEFVIKAEKHDDALESFLAQGILAQFSGLGERVSVPAYKTAVRWVGEYAPFFKRRPHLLPSALQFLFSMLPSHPLADSTAKAISHLCDSCRNHLVQHIEELMTAFEKFRVLPTANSYVKEKLIRAISTVGQALGSNDAKARYLEYVLGQFEEGARAALELFQRGQLEESSSLAHEVLRCLKIVGKAFQEPSVDLEDLNPKLDFWSQGAGQVVQSRVFNLLELPFVLKKDSVSIELLETACGAINSGLCENAGPFRLPASHIASFISRCDGADSLCTALSTANALVSAYSVVTSSRIDQEVAQIFLHVTTILLQVSPQNEPDLMHEALDFFARMCQKYLNVLFETSASSNGADPVLLINLLSIILLTSLTSDDPRPKRASATLWAKLLEKPKSAADVPYRSEWLIQNGQDLTGWLIWNFAGGASRSHIEFLLPVFNKLVFGYTMQVKAWMENSFRSDTFWPQNAKATEEERRVWAAKVLALRGRRKETKEVVEEFWLTCRGTAFRYTS